MTVKAGREQIDAMRTRAAQTFRPEMAQLLQAGISPDVQLFSKHISYKYGRAVQGHPAFTQLHDHVYGCRLVCNMVTSATILSRYSDIVSEYAHKYESLLQAGLGNACAPSDYCTMLRAMLMPQPPWQAWQDPCQASTKEGSHEPHAGQPYS